MTHILSEHYGKVMFLKIFVDDDTNDGELKEKYLKAANFHNFKVFNNPTFIDAGFDLYAPSIENGTICFYKGLVNKLDFKIKCSAKIRTKSDKEYNTGYYMYPRSSISKTNLRLANSIGVIDSGYRGNLMAMFDVVSNDNDNTKNNMYLGNKFDRYIQICAPSLMPIVVEIVDTLMDLGEETERGAGGFGSTGR
jgi:dUTP pyrophosphatase